MYKHARGFQGTRPSGLTSPSRKHSTYGKGPSIGPIGPEGVPSPKRKPKRPKNKIKLVPIKHTFADPKKASKAAQISGKLNRRMRGVIVERKNDHR